MKKELKKRVNKKVMILGLVLLSLLVLNFVLVYADTSTDSAAATYVPPAIDCSGQLGFFGRWECSLFNDFDAKMIVFLITTIIIYAILVSMDMGAGLSGFIALPFGFILTAFVTPASVLGVIRSYNTLPLTILIVLPTLVLFAFTYLSIYKAKRVLMAMQLIFWWIYFFLNALKLLVYWSITNDWGWFTTDTKFVADAIINIPPAGSATLVWFIIGLYGVTFISLLMSLGNGTILNVAARQVMGVDKNMVNQKLNDIGAGVKLLETVGKQAEGKKT